MLDLTGSNLITILWDIDGVILNFDVDAKCSHVIYSLNLIITAAKFV